MIKKKTVKKKCTRCKTQTISLSNGRCDDFKNRPCTRKVTKKKKCIRCKKTISLLKNGRCNACELKAFEISEKIKKELRLLLK